MAEVSKLSWLVPGFSSSALICFHEILIRACTNRYGISPEDFTLTWLMSGGLFCAHSPGPTPPHTAQHFHTARGGAAAIIALRKRGTATPYSLKGVPLWVFALVGWTLTQQEQLIKISTGLSPNPGMAKTIVNLNTGQSFPLPPLGARLSRASLALRSVDHHRWLDRVQGQSVSDELGRRRAGPRRRHPNHHVKEQSPPPPSSLLGSLPREVH